MNVSYLAGKLQDVMYNALYAQTDSSHNRLYHDHQKVDNRATIFLNANKYGEPMK